MNIFLEIYKFESWSLENLNISMNHRNWILNQKPSNNKNTGSDDLTDEFYENTHRFNIYLYQTVEKFWRRTAPKYILQGHYYSDSKTRNIYLLIYCIGLYLDHYNIVK